MKHRLRLAALVAVSLMSTVAAASAQANAFYNMVNPGLDANMFYVGFWQTIGR